MKELLSPVHAERMKVVPFGSLEWFRTEEPIFGSDACEAKDGAVPAVMLNRHRGTTDQTMTKTADVESEEGGDLEVTPVDVATQTTDSQGHDVGTESPNVMPIKGKRKAYVPLNTC